MAENGRNGAAVEDHPPLRYKRVTSQPENPFSALISNQIIAIIPSFTLESGAILHDVPVAYSTRGRLSPTRDNAMVICHALTGSADVSDWWGPLLGGPGRAMDISRFYVVCMNSLGSPYGTASPITYKDGDPSQGRYGPEFPLTTIRDDVNLHRLLLDDLGIRQVAVAIGGSMGGMLVLEWAYFGKDYIRSIVPIATSSQHSAWGISWGEAQRQSIYSDPKYEDGYYSFDDPPSTGLGAARMSALLTYRSRNSFEARFGRNAPDPSRQQTTNGTSHRNSPSSSCNTTTAASTDHFALHNDGHLNAGSPRPSSRNSAHTPPNITDPQFTSTSTPHPGAPITPPPTVTRRITPTIPHFSAQSYLRYQGQKFVHRFDSNCYIAITRKLDTHDITHHRPVIPAAPSSAILKHRTRTMATNNVSTSTSSPTPVALALSQIQQPTLVIGIQSDGLFTYAEQEELAAHIPDSRLKQIESPEGHDAFLLQFEQVNAYVLEFLREALPDIMGRPIGEATEGSRLLVVGGEVRGVGNEDVVGERRAGEIHGSIAVDVGISTGGVDGRNGHNAGYSDAGHDGQVNGKKRGVSGGGVTGEVDDITAW